LFFPFHLLDESQRQNLTVFLVFFVNDAKTIWLFRDTLTQKGIIDTLFKKFSRQLESQGIITHGGTIIDETFVDVPRQRNSRYENEHVKNGETPGYS